MMCRRPGPSTSRRAAVRTGKGVVEWEPFAVVAKDVGEGAQLFAHGGFTLVQKVRASADDVHQLSLNIGRFAAVGLTSESDRFRVITQAAFEF